jgi:hypothetical protein
MLQVPVRVIDKVDVFSLADIAAELLLDMLCVELLEL